MPGPNPVPFFFVLTVPAEIYQTERNHVRTLRLLEGIFMRPLQESGALPHELLNLLFPYSLIHLKDLHSAFEFKLKQRRSEHANVVREIGDLLLSMVSTVEQSGVGRSGGLSETILRFDPLSIASLTVKAVRNCGNMRHTSVPASRSRSRR